MPLQSAIDRDETEALDLALCKQQPIEGIARPGDRHDVCNDVLPSDRQDRETRFFEEGREILHRNTGSQLAQPGLDGDFS